MLLLLLLGLITYLIVQRVTTITRTPAWLLWLVVMTPALILTGWRIVYGEDKPIPVELVIGPFIICLFLYWFLIQWGRLPNPSASQSLESATPPEGQAPIAQSATPPQLPRLLDKSEESQLQSCFPWSVYYLQNIEHRPQAVICRGQLRTDPEQAYKTIQSNINHQFGRRFLTVFQEGTDSKPFFVLVPDTQAQLAEKNLDWVTRPLLALVLLVATLLTTMLAGLEVSGKPVNPEQIRLLEGLPYATALMAILGSHKLSQYLVARFHQIRATLPYFIPVLPVPFFPFGTFGAFVQLRSPVPNRKVLFDVGITGPLIGLVVSVPFLVWGLANSQVVPLKADAGMLDFATFNPRFSFLLALVSKVALGAQLTGESALNLHPVAIAAYLGLIVVAFNMMPVGQLDGGHVVHAMYGQRTGAVIGQFTRFLVLALFLVQRGDRLLLLWSILLFLMPIADEPALNDVTELNNRRDFLGLVMLGILLLIMLPAPKVITNLLGM